MSNLPHRIRNIREWLGGFLYGMMLYEADRYFRRERADVEHLFVLISFGNLLGIPNFTAVLQHAPAPLHRSPARHLATPYVARKRPNRFD